MTNSMSPIGTYAPDFELPDVSGAVHHLARHLETCRAVAVVIMCNHCPYVRGYLPRLKQLQNELLEQGGLLIGINPNDEKQFPDDSFEQMKQFAADHDLNFPYLRDMTQDVARTFGAEKTPQMFLLDSTGKIRYVGAIDDNPGDAKAVSNPYFKRAIAQLLSSSPIDPAETRAVGCSIKWRERSINA